MVNASDGQETQAEEDEHAPCTGHPGARPLRSSVKEPDHTGGLAPLSLLGGMRPRHGQRSGNSVDRLALAHMLQYGAGPGGTGRSDCAHVDHAVNAAQDVLSVAA